MESYSSIEQLEALSRLTERRKKRRRKKKLVFILSLILACLVSTVIWLEVLRANEPDQPFDLPASVQLQPLVLADNVPVSPTDFVLGLGGTGLRGAGYPGLRAR